MSQPIKCPHCLKSFPLEEGFKDDLDIILAETPNEKQTLLFSATMPKEVLRISKNYMSNPKKIEVAKIT